MGLFVKVIGHQLPISMIIGFRFLVSLILLLPILICSKGFSFKVKRPLLLIVRSLAGVIALMIFFFGVKFLPLAMATLLVMATPIYIPILAYFFANVKTSLISILGIIVSLIGVVLVIHPSGTHFSWIAVLTASSAIFAAIAYFCLRLLTRDHQSNQLLFDYFCISVICMTPLIIYYWKTPDLKQCLLLLGVGLSGAVYQIFLTHAIKLTKVRIISPLMLSGAVFGGIIDWLCWGQVPSVPEVIGAVIVLIGITWVVNSTKN
jgi:drug/metabolite transporter (DMT)-like permease